MGTLGSKIFKLDASSVVDAVWSSVFSMPLLGCVRYIKNWAPI